MFVDDGMLTVDHLNVYLKYFKLLKDKYPKPDLMIWLDASPEICLERIKKRGRESEKKISLEYQ